MRKVMEPARILFHGVLLGNGAPVCLVWNCLDWWWWLLIHGLPLAPCLSIAAFSSISLDSIFGSTLFSSTLASLFADPAAVSS